MQTLKAPGAPSTEFPVVRAPRLRHRGARVKVGLLVTRLLCMTIMAMFVVLVPPRVLVQTSLHCLMLSGRDRK